MDVGGQLRQARTARKLSLADISVRTKINQSILRAIEENRFDRVPGGLFTRGYCVPSHGKCISTPKKSSQSTGRNSNSQSWNCRLLKRWRIEFLSIRSRLMGLKTAVGSWDWPSSSSSARPTSVRENEEWHSSAAHCRDSAAVATSATDAVAAAASAPAPTPTTGTVDTAPAGPLKLAMRRRRLLVAATSTASRPSLDY